MPETDQNKANLDPNNPNYEGESVSAHDEDPNDTGKGEGVWGTDDSEFDRDGFVKEPGAGETPFAEIVARNDPELGETQRRIDKLNSNHEELQVRLATLRDKLELLLDEEGDTVRMALGALVDTAFSQGVLEGSLEKYDTLQSTYGPSQYDSEEERHLKLEHLKKDLLERYLSKEPEDLSNYSAREVDSDMKRFVNDIIRQTRAGDTEYGEVYTKTLPEINALNDEIRENRERASSQFRGIESEYGKFAEEKSEVTQTVDQLLAELPANFVENIPPENFMDVVDRYEGLKNEQRDAQALLEMCAKSLEGVNEGIERRIPATYAHLYKKVVEEAWKGSWRGVPGFRSIKDWTGPQQRLMAEAHKALKELSERVKAEDTYDAPIPAGELARRFREVAELYRQVAEKRVHHAQKALNRFTADPASSMPKAESEEIIPSS